jgi:glycosyltransferase involved in cell wall biosynthesis
VNDRTKEKFLAQAAALLFPIDWPEPFGLVMIEAIGRLGELDRRRVRARFEERFTARRMAQDYVALYDRIAVRSRRRVASA